ncbi:hypothetical protein MLD38_029267 [Melastoma candidum]|uniref:Uncharacterized protein n=1 Tax=Melastoma candidum TaxID=119954 RepID=A0ACB9N4Y1_9MYRT|nr:hypothetical protein MLD38_029267 [Melastoma candidum]
MKLSSWGLLLPALVVAVRLLVLTADAQCTQKCDQALASYYVWQGTNLTFISKAFGVSIAEIVNYNKNAIPNQDNVLWGTRINVPFTCSCLRDSNNVEFLGHVFMYSVMQGDTYSTVATEYYSNLTTAAWLMKFNTYSESGIPDTAVLNVTVNCSCGNSDVSKDYGLFITYPLRPEDTLASIAASENLTSVNITEKLLTEYNPGVNFSQGSGLVYIPGKDQNGNYPPLKSSAGDSDHPIFHLCSHDTRVKSATSISFMLSKVSFGQYLTGLGAGIIAGISVGTAVGFGLLALIIYVRVQRKKKVKEAMLLLGPQDVSGQSIALVGNSAKSSQTTGGAGATTPGLTGITVEKSVEFSYEELAQATDNFSLANKIGEGGFGAVFYAELRGEKAAIKKMDMQATKEFLAELKVLTHVHHLNLVRLIGYCVEGSLFLVYEYIENGNLSQHLRGSGRDPLSWSSRVQIALDSARGLEYIHEHTVPVYIHRDIKSANILIDKNFHAKVADFGLTKLTEVGSASLPTRLVGTFGYMPPEYAQYGDVSPKVDVYAFGVVLYELISAKEAVVKANNNVADSKGLVALFEEVLSRPDPKDDLCKLIDPRLGDNYPLDSVLKMAQLAKACTQENPQLRPSMRSIVVALMTLSSSTEDWDVGSFYENHAFINLMSGR